MDFWCHASALFAELGERARNSDLIKRRMLWRAAAAAVRTAARAHSGFQRAHRETPWRAASALASALSPRVVLVHRLLESAR